MKLIIFDLDGTLIDSVADITYTLNQLVKSMGFDPYPVNTVRHFIGKGVRHLLQEALRTDSSRILDEAEASYLKLYNQHLLDSTLPYPGTRETLEVLYSHHRLAVLTNKPERESRAILDGLNLSHFFDFVYGGDSLVSRKPNPVGIHSLMKKFGSSCPQTLMVGDSAVDLATARNARVKSCLVVHGAGNTDLFKNDSSVPDYRINHLGELIPILKSFDQ